MCNKFGGVFILCIIVLWQNSGDSDGVCRKSHNYKFDSAVQTFHQYHSIWTPVVGEELPCKREVRNPHTQQLICCSGDKGPFALLLSV